MIDIKVDNHTFTLYDNIKELPIGQFKEFQKATLQDAGVGSTIDDVRERVVKIFGFLVDDKKEFVQQELNNLFNATNFVMNGLSTKAECFIYLLKAVDGVKVNFEVNSAESYRELLNDIPFGELERVVEIVKKNYQPN
jgi:hypothetical protein